MFGSSQLTPKQRRQLQRWFGIRRIAGYRLIVEWSTSATAGRETFGLYERRSKAERRGDAIEWAAEALPVDVEFGTEIEAVYYDD